MFQISGGKETKSKKKGDSLQFNTFYMKHLFLSMCSFCPWWESFRAPASVCSGQVEQWRQRGGDKIKQVKEEVHSCGGIHVPNIWRQGQGEEKEKRQVHPWVDSPDELLEGVQPFVSVLCGRLAKADDSDDSASEKEEKTKKKKGKGKKKKVEEAKPAALCLGKRFVSLRQLMQFIHFARRGPRHLRSSLTTWRSLWWSRLARDSRSSAGWPGTRGGWTRTSTLSTTFTWTTTRRSGASVSLWATSSVFS